MLHQIRFWYNITTFIHDSDTTNASFIFMGTNFGVRIAVTYSVRKDTLTLHIRGLYYLAVRHISSLSNFTVNRGENVRDGVLAYSHDQ